MLRSQNIMQKFILFAAFLLPASLFAQTAQPKAMINNSNQRFDNAILKDAEIKVTRVTEFPASESPFTDKVILKAYRSETMLYDIDFKAILDDPKYAEADKVKFIKDALADTSRDAFKYIHSNRINFWNKSKEAKALIDNYFHNKQYEKSEDPNTRYKYFEFRTKSFYPETAQLITEYFASRPTLAVKYPYEIELIIQLKLMGKEEEAVKYLEIIVDDVIHDRLGKYVNYGERNATLTDGNVFEHLCLSENEAIAKKATDLLFNLVYQKPMGGKRIHFFELLEYVDKNRYHQVLDKWYAFYMNLDFSKIDTTVLKKHGWSKVISQFPDVEGYEGFMSFYSEYLADKHGKKFWNDFITKEKIAQYGNDDNANSQICKLEYVSKNKTVTREDLKQMLFQVIKTPNLFRSDNKARYLRLICQAYPDRKIPKADFDKLQLEKICAYSMPITLNEEALELPQYWEIPTVARVNKLAADINEFSRENNLNGISFHKKQTFLLSRLAAPDAGVIICDHLIKNNIIIEVDYNKNEEIAFSNYIDLFNSSFRKVLEKKNHHFSISQITQKIKEDEYRYQIYVKYNNTIYKTEYTGKEKLYQNGRRLMKMMNLCLMENKAKERIIEIKVDKLNHTFAFMEPAKLTPFLDKQSDKLRKIYYWATSIEDEFTNVNRR